MDSLLLRQWRPLKSNLELKMDVWFGRAWSEFFRYSAKPRKGLRSSKLLQNSKLVRVSESHFPQGLPRTRYNGAITIHHPEHTLWSGIQCSIQHEAKTTGTSITVQGKIRSPKMQATLKNLEPTSAFLYPQYTVDTQKWRVFFFFFWCEEVILMRSLVLAHLTSCFLLFFLESESTSLLFRLPWILLVQTPKC